MALPVHRTIAVDLKAEELARVLWSMDSREQATFFNTLAEITAPDEYHRGMQFGWIVADDSLTDEARRFVCVLADYFHLPESHGPVGCEDCGLPYGSRAWADFVVADDVWAQISAAIPGKCDEAMILCAHCMIARARHHGVEDEGRFTSGPFADDRWKKPASTGRA
jgi:hypothetical protein